MHWIHRHQLFLFDFDGLLVNTEELHYKAYVKMCANRNINLTWDFLQYSELAHHSATAVRDALYESFPQLGIEAPDWAVLYEEKRKAFLSLLHDGAAELMPGVSQLLEALQEANIKRCVVTHSSISLISTIRERHPVLKTIPHWITREDYSKPKPDSECYQVAISKFSKESDQIIGFEDSPRGLNALRGSRALPVLICPPKYPYVEQIKGLAHRYYEDFASIKEDNAP
jgi:beta-phosphoglucomutase